MVWILGINAHHAGSAACLLFEGRPVAAVEEERLSRIKHSAVFPEGAIRSCLEIAGVSMADIDHVAVNRDHRLHRVKKLRHLVTGRPRLRAVASRWRDRHRMKALPVMFAEAFADAWAPKPIHPVAHHLAHIASATWFSPFKSCLALSVDQFGDFESARWADYRAGRWQTIGAIGFPHSLGTFYSAITQWLGFEEYGEEYKVMGLSALGEDRFSEAMAKVAPIGPDGLFSLDLSFFRHHREAIYGVDDAGRPCVDTLYSSELETLLGPSRVRDSPLEPLHHDVACSLQRHYERALCALVMHARQQHPHSALALAGGCGLNAAANGRLLQDTPIERLFVQPASHDAGGALGAAAVIASNLGMNPPLQELPTFALGPSFDDDAVAEAIRAFASELAAHRIVACRVDNEQERYRRTATALAEGQIVAWFEGRMEWGPRALGHRSILADPRRLESKERINERVKRREAFRPFAPSVLSEAASDWFDISHPCPTMTRVAQVRPERRAAVAAVVHCDGTARLQTVHVESSPSFHRLIKAFEAQTGIPMLLNTSFNVHEPIVCSPKDAIACFIESEMDRLVIEQWELCR